MQLADAGPHHDGLADEARRDAVVVASSTVTPCPPVRHASQIAGNQLGREYVLAISAHIGVFGPETSFSVPERKPGRGRPPSVARPDRKPESVRALAERLPAKAFKTVPCRTTPSGEIVHGRFAFVRVAAAHAATHDHRSMATG